MQEIQPGVSNAMQKVQFLQRISCQIEYYKHWTTKRTWLYF